jgi:hypothetical protein
VTWPLTEGSIGGGCARRALRQARWRRVVPVTVSIATSRCSAVSGALLGRGVGFQAGGRGNATKTASTASSKPRSPSERTIHPNSRAEMSSSDVSSSRTPPCSTAGSVGKRPAVRTHCTTSAQPPQVRPVTDLVGPRPRPRFSRLAIAVLGQRSWVAPVLAEVFRLSWFGDFEAFSRSEAQRAMT